MVPIGESYLEKKDDGSFQLSKPSIVWRFTKEQLSAEIAKLQNELVEKQELFDAISVMC